MSKADQTETATAYPLRLSLGLGILGGGDEIVIAVGCRAASIADLFRIHTPCATSRKNKNLYTNSPEGSQILVAKQ